MDEQLQRALQEWTAEERLEHARQTRQSQHWQKQVASEEARFSGLLVDLFEQRCEIAVATAGHRFIGTIDELGTDFVFIASVFVHVEAISAIEVEGKHGVPGIREPNASRSFDEVVTELAATGEHIRFTTRTNTQWQSARLTACGLDVTTFEIDGPPIRTLFVPLEQISEITVA